MIILNRILITGSRDWENEEVIHNALREEYKPGLLLVSGACPTGADSIAEKYWESLGGEVERHPANWVKYGRAAGPMRNKKMVYLGADTCLAFIRNNSKGATGTVKLAKEAGIPVKIFIS